MVCISPIKMALTNIESVPFFTGFKFKRLGFYAFGPALRIESDT